MKLHDITSLKRNQSQSDLYDLSEPTFNFTSTRYFERTILPEEEMRIEVTSRSKIKCSLTLLITIPPY